MQKVRTEHNKESIGMVIIRGMFGHCPRCGQGRLFRSYLKPVETCAVCSEQLGHIRADDGPAWLTILLTGPLLALFILRIAPNSPWPDEVSMVVGPAAALVLALAILPRAKGIFIGLIWRANSMGSEK